MLRWETGCSQILQRTYGIHSSKVNSGRSENTELTGEVNNPLVGCLCAQWQKELFISPKELFIVPKLFLVKKKKKKSERFYCCILFDLQSFTRQVCSNYTFCVHSNTTLLCQINQVNKMWFAVIRKFIFKQYLSPEFVFYASWMRQPMPLLSWGGDSSASKTSHEKNQEFERQK